MVKMTVTSKHNPSPRTIAVAAQCIMIVEHDIEYIMTLITGEKYNIKSIYYYDLSDKLQNQSIFCSLDEVLDLIFQ